MTGADLGAGRTLPMPFVLTVIGLGAFITALDQTVVVTALPSVMLDLKVPISELDRVAWVITAYLLGYTVAMPLIGRLGDVYGYPRVYQASLVIFCIGTSLVAVSSSVLNQALEKETDARMDRTANRPLPSSRLTLGEAILFGFCSGVGGWK